MKSADNASDSRTCPFGNAGSSCNINAALQALLAVQDVRQVCEEIYNDLPIQQQGRLSEYMHASSLQQQDMDMGTLTGDKIRELLSFP